MENILLKIFNDCKTFTIIYYVRKASTSNLNHGNRHRRYVKKHLVIFAARLAANNS